MTEPTLKEVTTWKNKLENKTFLKNLKQFQQQIYRVCEEYRLMMGMLFIRVILPRHDVKGLESVVNKIARNRRKNSRYSFDDVDDLIGIKILCPYLSSAKKVGKWLYSQTEHFDISPKTVSKAWVSRKTGYTGYHFIATPNTDKNPHWLDLKCEIQVKTMCQEAWDAQTHEITYKQEESIDSDLMEHMQQLSKVLATIDNQGEIIKNQIQRVELEERERKDAAAIVYLYESTGLLKILGARYRLNLSSKNPRQLKAKDLIALNRAIHRYHSDEGVSKELCFLAALLAICQKHPKQEELALTLAREFVEKKPRDPMAEYTRASVFWALNRFNEAIACAGEALRKAKTKRISVPDLDELTNSYCYWVADAAMAGIKIKRNLSSETLKLGETLYRTYPDNPGILDTAGYLRIVFGETVAEIEEGIGLIRKARKIVDHEKRYPKRITKTFGRRHERLGFLRLAKIVREKG